MIQRPAFAETPRQALELRRKLLSWYSNMSEAELAWMQRVIPLPSAAADVEVSPEELRKWAAQVAAREMVIARHGSLFLISDEMTEVARAAALTLPSFVLEREDFPAENGLVIFHHPPATHRSKDGETADLVAATWWWGQQDGKYGVAFQWYEDRDGGSLLPDIAPEKAALVRQYNRDLLPKLTPANWALIPFGEDFASALASSPLLPTVVSTLLLMQQPLAAVERERSAPLDSRRARRAGMEDTGITVVRLRHLKTATGAAVVRPKEYRHRWIVRGHWRNQWLPSRGVHRPTWINPHVKGPEHAPIKVTEKVNVWSR